MPRQEQNSVNNFFELLPVAEYRSIAEHSAMKDSKFYVDYNVRVLDALARMFSVLGPSTATFFDSNELNQKCLYVFSNTIIKKQPRYGNFETQKDVFVNLTHKVTAQREAVKSKSLGELLEFLLLNDGDSALIGDFFYNSKTYQATTEIILDLKGRVVDLRKRFSSIESSKHHYEVFEKLQSLTLELTTIGNALNNKTYSTEVKATTYLQIVKGLVPSLIENRLFEDLKNIEDATMIFGNFITNFSNVLGEFIRPFVDLVKITLYAAHNPCFSDIIISGHNPLLPSKNLTDEDLKILQSHAELKGTSVLWQCYPPGIVESEPDLIEIHKSTDYFGSSLLCCAECFVAASLTKKIGFRGTHSCYFDDAGDPVFLKSIGENERYHEIVSNLRLSKNIRSTADGYLSDDEDYTPEQLQQFIQQKTLLSPFIPECLVIEETMVLSNESVALGAVTSDMRQDANSKAPSEDSKTDNNTILSNTLSEVIIGFDSLPSEVECAGVSADI